MPVADGLWMSVSDLAKQKGISKQALAKRVGRLEAQGLLSVRSGHQKRLWSPGPGPDSRLQQGSAFVDGVSSR